MSLSLDRKFQKKCSQKKLRCLKLPQSAAVPNKSQTLFHFRVSSKSRIWTSEARELYDIVQIYAEFCFFYTIFCCIYTIFCWIFTIFCWICTIFCVLQDSKITLIQFPQQYNCQGQKRGRQWRIINTTGFSSLKFVILYRFTLYNIKVISCYNNRISRSGRCAGLGTG